MVYDRKVPVSSAPVVAFRESVTQPCLETFRTEVVLLNFVHS